MGRRSNVVRRQKLDSDFKESVRTIVDLDGLPPYTSDGQILTADGPGLLPDQAGVALALNNHVIIDGAAPHVDVGAYVMTQLDPFQFTRRSDFNSSANVSAGIVIKVEEGDFEGKFFELLTPNPIVLNTTPLDMDVQAGGGAGIFSIIAGKVDIPENQQLVNIDGLSIGIDVANGGVLDGEGSLNQLDLDRHFMPSRVAFTQALQILEEEVVFYKGIPDFSGIIYGGGIVAPIESSAFELLDTLGDVLPEGHFLVGGGSPATSASPTEVRDDHLDVYAKAMVYTKAESDSEIATQIEANPGGLTLSPAQDDSFTVQLTVDVLQRIGGSGNVVQVNMPSSPSDGDRCGFIQTGNLGSGNGITLQGNGSNFMLFDSFTSSFSWRVGASRGLEFAYSANSNAWLLTGGDLIGADNSGPGNGLVFRRDQGYSYFGAGGSTPRVPYWSSASNLASTFMASWSVLTRPSNSTAVASTALANNRVLGKSETNNVEDLFSYQLHHILLSAGDTSALGDTLTTPTLAWLPGNSTTNWRRGQFVQWTGASDLTVGGIQEFDTDDEWRPQKVLHNLSASSVITFTDEDLSASSVRRIRTLSGGFRLGPGEAVLLHYERGVGRWYILGTANPESLFGGSANHIAFSNGSGVPTTTAVAVQSVIGRQNGGDINDIAVQADSWLGRQGSGVFQSNSVQANQWMGRQSSGVLGGNTVGTNEIVLRGAGNLGNTAIADSQFVGRPAGGSLGPVTKAQALTILNVEDGADATDATNVDAAGAVMESDFNAQTILAATADNTPLPLTVPDNSFVGRFAGGNVGTFTMALAHQILRTDNVGDITPYQVLEQHLVGRITGGSVIGINATQIRTLINVEDGSTADQTGAEIKTAYEAEANAYTDAKDTKLTGIETNAKDDQSAGEVAYTPAVTGDWNSSDPATVAAALDRIAALLGPIT